MVLKALCFPPFALFRIKMMQKRSEQGGQVVKIYLASECAAQPLFAGQINNMQLNHFSLFWGTERNTCNLTIKELKIK